MGSGKITKRSVDALKATERDQFLWDSERRGFGFKRTPAGKGVFLIQYRMHGGRKARTKRYTIGSMGIWTPESAGKEAERLLRMVAQGVDPAREKHRARHNAQELEINVFSKKFYNDEVLPNWERSSDGVEMVLRLYISPHIGHVALPDLTTQELAAFLRKLDSPSKKYKSFAILRRMFRWAKAEGYIETNPIADFPAPPPPKERERWLRDEEIKVFWEASHEISPLFGPIYRLLLITGQRKNQVAGALWKEFDRERRVWIIPSSRGKNKKEHAVPLSDLAIKELDQLAGGEDWPKVGLQFTTTGKTPVSGFSKIKGDLDAEMLKIIRKTDPDGELDHWVNHDLRRTMATNMQRLGVPNEHIEATESRIAGRSKPGAAGAYLLWEFYDEKRVALEKWSGFLAALLSGDNNVVPLIKRA